MSKSFKIDREESRIVRGKSTNTAKRATLERRAIRAAKYTPVKGA